MAEREFFRERLSTVEIRELAGMSSADEMFAWNSPSAKEYRGRRGRLSDEELFELMSQEPRLIRRPVLVRHGEVTFGFPPGHYV